MAVVWLLSENIVTEHEGAAVINRELNLYHDLFEPRLRQPDVALPSCSGQRRSRKLGVGFTLTLFKTYECWVLRVSRVSGW
ncbi:hypothetical protein MCOR23_005047 [Pyricularia oryzae]|nr:hypothetical protein MCOR23_005047 [Pyricularia oryzae]